jgi:hypothetical protein
MIAFATPIRAVGSLAGASVQKRRGNRSAALRCIDTIAQETFVDSEQ